jgi:hypothetical protein
LHLESFGFAPHNQEPFTISSLQFLSTLQQLEELHLGSCTCAATSLHSLAGLSNLTRLELNPTGKLSSLEGINPGVKEVSVSFVRGLVSLAGIDNCTQLTALNCDATYSELQEPWGLLAMVTSLQRLTLAVAASGDPSPLSALTGLTYLNLRGAELRADKHATFSFSSLQPLSTLQQLQELHLGKLVCAATSLQGLAGLSNLKVLRIASSDHGKLVSLEGISPGVVEVFIQDAPNLVSLSGIEGCRRMEKLTLKHCTGVSSLQPLRGLSSLKQLDMWGLCLTSLESFHSMSLQSLRMYGCKSLTHLSGVEHLSALKSLEVSFSHVTSLQPLSLLGEGLQKLTVSYCAYVQEELLELPHVQPTADVDIVYSNVREVVLAGGFRRAVGPPRRA